MPPEIDYEEMWSHSVATYKSHPTSRHRRRYVLNALRKHGLRPGDSVFDYGCGPALLLEQVSERFGIAPQDLAGCDTAVKAVEEARKRFPHGEFHVGEFPEVSRQFEVCITTEVIEHTAEYQRIIAWLAEHLKPGGLLVVTTPGGTLDPPDAYYGHVQHFKLEQLTELINRAGLNIQHAAYWGWPLFTLQKWVTKRNFEKIKQDFMHGDLDLRKKILFGFAYRVYFIHDLIPAGPQIFISARKP